MKSNLKAMKKSNPMMAVIVIFGVFGISQTLNASQPVEDQNSTPCGILEKFAGIVQILDAGRSRVVDVSRAVPIACGGSVSVGSGWAQIKHRDGFKFFLAAGSFIEMPEPNLDGKFSGEHVLLYRGQLYAQLASGAGEFRVLTANARAKQAQGTMVVVYNRDELLTQLITLENFAILENRFQPAAFVKVKSGEASQLNFKLMRVTPSDPRAVAIAPLRVKLKEFNLSEPDHKTGIAAAKVRLDRKFASSLGESESEYFKRRESRKSASGKERGGQSSRDMASSPESSEPAEEKLKRVEELKRKSALKYEQHVAESEDVESDLYQNWQSHVTGIKKEELANEERDENANELLFPSQEKKKSKSRWLASKKSMEQVEKKRLLEELTKLKDD